jgi:hypothetical protein
VVPLAESALQSMLGSRSIRAVARRKESAVALGEHRIGEPNHLSTSCRTGLRRFLEQTLIP